MIGKKEMALAGGAPADVKAILGEGSEFEGKLRFEGTVRIDGKFRGEVHSEGTLIVGERANIEGEMEVDSAVISGEIRGNIRAKSKVELRPPAKLYGNIQAPVLVIQEGVIFDGNCQMTKEGAKAAKGAPTTPNKPASEPKPAG